jgi:adenylate cyclase
VDVGTFAARTGVDASRIDGLIRLGILRPAADGSLDDAQINTARLAFAFAASGIALEDLGAAIEHGALPDVGALLQADPVSLLPRSHREVAGELGLSDEQVRAVLEALGLPDVDLDAPIREDDAEMLGLAASALGTGLPPETLIRTLGVFAEHLDRMAEHQRALFRRDIQDRLLAAGMPRAQMLEASAAIRSRLVELGFRASSLIHHRLLERQQFENTAEQMELLLQEAGIRRRPDPEPPGIVFVDLSGFTRLTEEEGDEGAAERGARLASLVRSAAARRGGRVVKLLGDGAMLQFERAADAVAGAADVTVGTGDLGLPAARAGIAVGPLIRRDGDFFGHTVNLAARICDAAGGGTVTAAREVVDRTPELTWQPVGHVSLKGIPVAVPLFRLDVGSAEVEQV